MATAVRPNRIEGWMGAKGRRWLRKQARRHTAIVEVGCWKGLSTKILAKGTKGRVWAVDTWAGTPDDPGQHERLYAPLMGAGPAEVFREFKRNLRSYIKLGRVKVCRGPSLEIAEALARSGHRFDFVFIDADHSYEAVAADIRAWRPLVIPGGLLSGHDYKESWPSVMRAVDELVPGVVVGPSSIWSVRV